MEAAVYGRDGWTGVQTQGCSRTETPVDGGTYSAFVTVEQEVAHPSDGHAWTVQTISSDKLRFQGERRVFGSYAYARTQGVLARTGQGVVQWALCDVQKVSRRGQLHDSQRETRQHNVLAA